jgi:hypothetical protein
MMKIIIKTVLLFPVFFALVNCSSIQPIGTIGPKKLNVYAISNTDFFSANRMLVILDKDGNVATATGGTVAGAGTIGLQTVSSLATAGSIYYGTKAIQRGLQNSNVNVKGIPSKIDVKTDSTVHIPGLLPEG